MVCPVRCPLRLVLRTVETLGILRLMLDLPWIPPASLALFPFNLEKEAMAL